MCGFCQFETIPYDLCKDEIISDKVANINKVDGKKAPLLRMNSL